VPTTPEPNSTPSYPGLIRRLAAIVYDSLMLIALIMLATALVMPLTDGQAITRGRALYQTYLLFVCFGYFAWFWSHGGQTIGMRAWKIRVQSVNGKPLSMWQILLRFLAAMGSWLVVGIGFMYALFNSKHQTWHDLVSETELVHVDKNRQL